MLFSLALLSSVASAESEEPDDVSKRQADLSQAAAAQQSATHTVKPVNDTNASGEYRTVEWPELMPQDDLDAILNSPDYLDDIADGSAEDVISNQLQSATAEASDNRYQQALVSTRVIEAFHNQAIRIPGFIVPLEFDDQQTITRFFLVPYFGACIHVPPPPPNQIIYAAYPKGFKLDALYQPFWITGVLKTTLTENDMATSAYSISVDAIEPYSE